MFIFLSEKPGPTHSQPLLQQELQHGGRSRWIQRIRRRRKNDICINGDSSEVEEPQQQAEVSSHGGPLAIWQAATVLLLSQVLDSHTDTAAQCNGLLLKRRELFPGAPWTSDHLSSKVHWEFSLPFGQKPK